jgi:RNA polymerase sigma-70 factor (ECF subfamily)
MDAMDSVEGLFRQEFGRLVRSFSVAFGVEEAADAVQEAFVVADGRWERISRLDDVAGWVRRVALNRLLNERRRQRRHTEILDAIGPAPAADVADDLLDLDRAIKRLPQQQRLALCLHYLGGYKIDEVAEMMQIASGTVKAHLHAARATLRISLAEVEP